MAGTPIHSETDVALLRRAVALARMGREADPNPRVGAVIAGPDGVVGEGWHHGAGTPHAEIEALRDAGPAARGATAYVSLEPCNHTGRTGPCTQALLDAGIARVVYATSDPNPVAAGGAAMLREHGVEVDQIAWPGAEDVNRSWLFAVRTGRAMLTWKFAATLDGRSAAADATSRWITGVTARVDAQRLRSQCGAIVAGTGTVLADDPQLTVRVNRGDPEPPPEPLRVVVGRRPIPADAHVHDAEAPTWFTHEPLPRILADLWARGIHHALLEGGPTLAAAFWRAGLVDEVVAYIAPALLGAGPSAVADLGIRTIDGIARLELTDVTRIGADVRLTLRPASGVSHEGETHVHRNR